jgi:hypothetical protein
MTNLGLLLEDEDPAEARRWYAQAAASRAAARPAPPVDEHLPAAIGDRITAAGGALSTTLERLAADLRIGVDQLRRVVLDLESIDFLVARRYGHVVSVDELAVHARIELSQT